MKFGISSKNNHEAPKLRIPLFLLWNDFPLYLTAYGDDAWLVLHLTGFSSLSASVSCLSIDYLILQRNTDSIRCGTLSRFELMRSEVEQLVRNPYAVAWRGFEHLNCLEYLMHSGQ